MYNVSTLDERAMMILYIMYNKKAHRKTNVLFVNI